MSGYQFKSGNKKVKVSGAEAAAMVVGLIIASIMIFFFSAWIIMLVMGALHAEVAASIPAIGYFGACILTFALSLVASFFKRN